MLFPGELKIKNEIITKNKMQKIAAEHTQNKVRLALRLVEFILVEFILVEFLRGTHLLIETAAGVLGVRSKPKPNLCFRFL